MILLPYFSKCLQYVHYILMEGTMSQIFDLGPSFEFI